MRVHSRQKHETGLPECPRNCAEGPGLIQTLAFVRDILAIIAGCRAISPCHRIGYQMHYRCRFAFACLTLLLTVRFLDGETWKNFDVPGQPNQTYPLGVSGENTVGYYDSHGFFYDGTSFQTLDDPDAVNFMVATGVSGNSVAGNYFGADGIRHGFVFDGTTWSRLDDPFALASQGRGRYSVSGGCDQSFVRSCCRAGCHTSENPIKDRFTTETEGVTSNAGISTHRPADPDL